MNNNFTIRNRSLQTWVAVLVFSFPFLSLITLIGVGLSSFLLLLTALFLWRDCRAALVRHWDATRWVILAFLFNLLVVLVFFLLRPDASAGNLEKPSRMLFAVSAMLLVVVARPGRSSLWWGVIAGAVACLPLVAWQRLVEGNERPGGLINAITFGDLSMCLALVAMVAAIDFRHSNRQAVWPALGALAGLGASLLTGTRGAWVALLLAGLLFVRHAHLMDSRRVRALLAGSLLLVAGAMFVPATGMQARVVQGIDDVQTWMDGGSAFSNVGIRLELWKGAGLLIAERPFSGVDHRAVGAAMARHVQAGRLDPVVLPAEHLHNDALQSLVTGGVAGLLAWLAILAAPFAFFARAIRGASMRAERFAPALAGMVVVTCFFSFGLTEVIFWSVKGSMFYALMVFLLMGFCLNAKEQIGK